MVCGTVNLLKTTVLRMYKQRPGTRPQAKLHISNTHKLKSYSLYSGC